jgi:hypothetical protein
MTCPLGYVRDGCLLACADRFTSGPDPSQPTPIADNLIALAPARWLVCSLPEDCLTRLRGSIARHPPAWGEPSEPLRRRVSPVWSDSRTRHRADHRPEAAEGVTG